jgi:hypothetical protein
MNIVFSSFRLPKAGNALEECEDWAATHPRLEIGRSYELKDSPLGYFRFAVADGATEGMFSSKWAEMLVKNFCRSKNSINDVKAVVDKASRNWDSWMGNYLKERGRRNKPVQWYEEPGLKAGSFSTILGLKLSDSGEMSGGRWEATAIGDTCLFQVRNETLAQKFPIGSSSEFNNRPVLVSSNPVMNKKVFELNNSVEGDWGIGDSFYLMTDALACWFLQEWESGSTPWNALSEFESAAGQDAFQTWVEDLRFAKKIRNDDITLIHIRVF